MSTPMISICLIFALSLGISVPLFVLSLLLLIGLRARTHPDGVAARIALFIARTHEKRALKKKNKRSKKVDRMRNSL